MIVKNEITIFLGKHIDLFDLNILVPNRHKTHRLVRVKIRKLAPDYELLIPLVNFFKFFF